MKWCKCATKPLVIRGLCHVCRREPGPGDSRNPKKSLFAGKRLPARLTR